MYNSNTLCSKTLKSGTEKHLPLKKLKNIVEVEGGETTQLLTSDCSWETRFWEDNKLTILQYTVTFTFTCVFQVTVTDQIWKPLYLILTSIIYWSYRILHLHILTLCHEASYVLILYWQTNPMFLLSLNVIQPHIHTRFSVIWPRIDFQLTDEQLLWAQTKDLPLNWHHSGSHSLVAG